MAKVAWANVGSKIITRLNKLAFLDENTYTPSVGDTTTWDGSQWVPDSGTYVAKTGAEIWVPAASMHGVAGSTSLGAINFAWPVWLLDASATERAGCAVRFPSWWSTFHFDFYYANAGAGSGDVRLDAYYSWASDGTDLSTGNNTMTSGTTVTVPGQNVLDVVRLGTDLSVNAARFAHFRTGRVGGNGADTLANDIGLLGVMLTRAS